jgi:hypothetical protein
MSSPHTTLRPKTNIAMIIVWGSVTAITFLLCNPRPFFFVGIGCFFGLVGGSMQVLSFNEGKESFLYTASAMEVRAKLKATKWGKRYLYFLWSCGMILVVLSLIGSKSPAFAFPVAYFSMMFARDAVTLKSTFELGRMQTELHE